MKIDFNSEIERIIEMDRVSSDILYIDAHESHIIINNYLSKKGSIGGSTNYFLKVKPTTKKSSKKNIKIDRNEIAESDTNIISNTSQSKSFINNQETSAEKSIESTSTDMRIQGKYPVSKKTYREPEEQSYIEKYDKNMLQEDYVLAAFFAARLSEIGADGAKELLEVSYTMQYHKLMEKRDYVSAIYYAESLFDIGANGAKELLEKTLIVQYNKLIDLKDYVFAIYFAKRLLEIRADGAKELIKKSCTMQYNKLMERSDYSFATYFAKMLVGIEVDGAKELLEKARKLAKS